ncbi:4-coumarate--coa ligase-like 9 [Phtheirospermum japonicum]|uniref:4-coumarate--coa ligase-like 9 n=1 Tax=Phtheirospermum japonicum TaxID=374723 RepID=A0A830C4S2_9LAMI|nr:4-coumarate--coa ligase-like 9 [Phtheirospermum japonicum]
MNKPDPSSIDPRSGFCPETKIFHSPRPPVPLPPENTPLSVAGFAISLQSTTSHPDTAALINSDTGHRISYSQFIRYVTSLAFSLRSEVGLSRNDVAFVLSSNSTRVPILYFALLSIGVAVSPANPISTKPEISRQINISKPAIAFATSETAVKLASHRFRTILIDSADFEDMMTKRTFGETGEVEVRQKDVAAILFSSGTTGQVKGVAVTHRSLIAVTTNYYQQRQERSSPTVGLYTVPYFHVFGFHYCLKSLALGDAVVVTSGRFDLGKMLRAVEEHKVTLLAAAAPVVVGMVKSDLTQKFDLGSLEAVGCGAAPLGIDLIEAFAKKFQRVSLFQGYGMTETSGVAFRPVGDDEYARWGSVGKLIGTNEAKIIDLETGIGLPPGKQGELWIKGPTIMKGYVDDDKANYETLVSGGWLRMGDICYIDDEGFLFVVDRVKELIKYKGYQVSPAELEQLLLSHPNIVDAAVIPYPDEVAGQVPLAFVVRRPKSNLDERQIIEFIEKQVAPYKKIRRVAFISSVPRSAAGKILRKDLRKSSLPDSKL